MSKSYANSFKQILFIVVEKFMELGLLNKIENDLNDSNKDGLKDSRINPSQSDNEEITINNAIGNYFNLSNNNFSVSTIDWLNSQYRI